MINRVTLLGRVGQDPVYREIGETDLCSFSVATSEKFKNKSNEWVETTEWHDCKVWGKQAKYCADILVKGSMVYVEGSIKSNEFKNKAGDTVKSKEINVNIIKFLDKKPESKPQAKSERYDDEPPARKKWSPEPDEPDVF